jgi:hypothetical protein
VNQVWGKEVGAFGWLCRDFSSEFCQGLQKSAMSATYAGINIEIYLNCVITQCDLRCHYLNGFRDLPVFLFLLQVDETSG